MFFQSISLLGIFDAVNQKIVIYVLSLILGNDRASYLRFMTDFNEDN